MRTLLFTMLILANITGCQLTRVEGEVEDVQIKVSTKDNHDSYGKFCPPGQAKKGNC